MDVRPPSGQVENYWAPGLKRQRLQCPCGQLPDLLEEQYCLSVCQTLEHSTIDRENLITLAQVKTGKLF